MIVRRIQNRCKLIRVLARQYKLRFPVVFVQYMQVRKKYNMSLGNFITLGYVDMSKEQKESLLFMPEYLGNCFKINPFAQLKVLRDKRTVIQRLPQYLGRECRIEDFKDQAGFMAFTKRHTSFYAKKNFKAAGVGTRVYRNVDTEEERQSAYKTCQEEELTIIEAFIEQHDVICEIYPHVVNTIRIHTMRTKDGIKIVLTPEFYIPSGGEKDTVHSKKDRYNLFIDIKSGKLWDKAFRIDALGLTSYGETSHCDTGTVFGDITIPYWEKVKEMVIDGASYIPELSYIGWDVAITPEGPVIIEGNAISGLLSSYQVKKSMVNGGYGVREEFEEMFALAKL